MRVAVALDTVGDRIALQGSLPRWIVNAWTQTSDLGVSRHDFDGPGPCLACLYMPRGTPRNEDEIVTDELRMPEALMEIRRLLQIGEPIGKPFVERIAQAMRLPIEPLIAFADQPSVTVLDPLVSTRGEMGHVVITVLWHGRTDGAPLHQRASA